MNQEISDSPTRNFWSLSTQLGLGFLAITVVWLIYNLFVPLYLQSGNPDFRTESNLRINGFGLNATMTGFVMTLDNIAALFLLPFIGMWSDRIRTPIGRRYPFILASAPVAAVAFIVIPVAGSMIPLESSGSLAGNLAVFALFMAAVLVLLTAMAVLRTPVIALMPDIFPSSQRSKANGVIDFMGGIGTLVAVLVIARLFDLTPVLPFLVTSMVLMGTVVWMFLRVKERRILAVDEGDPQNSPIKLLDGLKAASHYSRSIILLLAAVFGIFAGFGIIVTFFSSYSVTTLNLTISEASSLFAASLISFMVFSVPAALIATKFGRKWTVIAGLAVFALSMSGAYVTTDIIAVALLLASGGLGFALILTNLLPMVIDVHSDIRTVGTFTGLYYVASQLGEAISPIVGGAVVDWTGRDYQSIFLVSPLLFAISILCMLLVRDGEPHAVEKRIAK